MDTTRQSNCDQPYLLRPISRLWLVAALVITCAAQADLASAQVRTKKQDRGVYRSPRITEVDVESESAAQRESRIAELVRKQAPVQRADQPVGHRRGGGELVRRRSNQPATTKRPVRELVEVEAEWEPTAKEAAAQPPRIKKPTPPKLQQVDHQDVILVEPQYAPPVTPETIHHSGEVWVDNSATWDEGTIIHDGTCDGCSNCVGEGCDSIGCDSIGDCCSPWYSQWSNGSISFDRGRWFGSAELWLMFRNGNGVPPLVTTSPDTTDFETSGELSPEGIQGGTQILVGNGSILDDMSVGGMFSLGTWLDQRQCRSLVLRGWHAGESDFGFSANQAQLPVITRPFFNVTDNQVAEEDTQLIAFPDRVDGSIVVGAESNVYGADISVRQFAYGKYGGTVDFLYGYQFMRLDEDLGISGTSTSLDDDFAPVGSIISVADSFDVDNEFHGGQFGVATRYREGCWSFDGMMKFGFGSLRRRVRRVGTTLTSIDGSNAIDPNGLLVRSTNAGTFSDDTFGWVPELSASIGWQRYPCFDVTFGYHVIGMTDALQLNGVIDPERAVNLASPPMDQQRPVAAVRYHTAYVHGLHFGLQHVY